jgi:hypothetical protein
VIKEDYAAFLKQIDMLRQIYGGELSDSVVQLYWAAFEEYTLEEFLTATTHIVRTHKWNTFPKPAEFVEYMQPVEDMVLKGEDGLKALYDMQSDVGYYGSPVFTDPALKWTVDAMGGWCACISDIRSDVMDHKDFGFWERRFKDLYARCYQQGRKPVTMKAIGFHEQHNANILSYKKEVEEQKLLEHEEVKKITKNQSRNVAEMEAGDD